MRTEILDDSDLFHLKEIVEITKRCSTLEERNKVREEIGKWLQNHPLDVEYVAEVDIISMTLHYRYIEGLKSYKLCSVDLNVDSGDLSTTKKKFSPVKVNVFCNTDYYESTEKWNPPESIIEELLDIEKKNGNADMYMKYTVKPGTKIKIRFIRKNIYGIPTPLGVAEIPNFE